MNAYAEGADDSRKMVLGGGEENHSKSFSPSSNEGMIFSFGLFFSNNNLTRQEDTIKHSLGLQASQLYQRKGKTEMRRCLRADLAGRGNTCQKQNHDH